MKLGLSLLLVIFTTPVNAHCYSVWHYPWKQHCGYSPTGRGNGLKTHQVRVRPSLPAPKAPEEDNSWYVEVTKMPATWDEKAHDDGIQMLKDKMK